MADASRGKSTSPRTHRMMVAGGDADDVLCLDGSLSAVASLPSASAGTAVADAAAAAAWPDIGSRETGKPHTGGRQAGEDRKGAEKKAETLVQLSGMHPMHLSFSTSTLGLACMHCGVSRLGRTGIRILSAAAPF